MELRKQIDNYLDWCVNTCGMSKHTIHSKKYVLKMFIENAGVSSMEECTNKHINDWLDSMCDRVQPTTLVRYMKDIRSFVRFIKESEICSTQVKIAYIKKFKVGYRNPVVFYNQMQIERVLKECSGAEALMIKLLFDSGMRINEFRQIKVRDIDLEKCSIIVNGKGGKRAIVYFTYTTAFLLADFIAKNRLLLHDYLWKSEANGGLPYTVNTLRCKLRIPFVKAGYNNFHPHALRHSFATDLIKNGATIQQVQHLLRHNEQRTTELYIHNLDNNLDRVYRKLKRQGEYAFGETSFTRKLEKERELKIT